MASFLLNVALFAVFAVTLLYYYLTRTFRYFKKQGINGPVPIPVFGTYWGVWNKQYHRHLLKEVKQYGKVYGEFEGTLPSLVVSDLNLVKQILVKDFDCFSNRRRFFEGIEYLKYNLNNLDTADWKETRKAMTPAFSSGKLKKLIEPMIECADTLVNQLHEDVRSNGSTDVNFKDVAMRLTLDIIASCVFGMKLQTLKDPNNEFVNRAVKVIHGQPLSSPMANMAIMLCNFYPAILKVLPVPIIQDIDVIAGVAKKMISEKKANTSQSETDLLSIFLQHTATNESSVFNDESALLSQMIVFLLAGFDTPSTAMGFLMHCLVMHQDVQDNLRKEIRDSLKRHGGLTYECVQDVPYLDQCIDEALRLYPPASKTERLCNKTVNYGNIRIEKGTLVSIPIYAIHHDPEIYPEPDKFLPSRFSPEEKAKRDPTAHLAFGEGPRSCIGKRFSLETMKIAMIKLIDNFRFVPNRKTQDPPATAPGLFVISAMMAPEIWMRVEKCN